MLAALTSRGVLKTERGKTDCNIPDQKKVIGLNNTSPTNKIGTKREKKKTGPT